MQQERYNLLKFSGILFALISSLVVFGSLTAYAASPGSGAYGFSSWFGNFSNQTWNFIHNPINGHHFRPPGCNPNDYGYGCQNTTVYTTTVRNQCSGTPVVTFSPSTVPFTQGTQVVVSGLSGCSGKTIYIKPWNGCSNSTTITSFVSGYSGGSAFISNRSFSGGYGQNSKGGSYGYYACVDHNTNQQGEGNLTVTGSSGRRHFF